MTKLFIFYKIILFLSNKQSFDTINLQMPRLIHIDFIPNFQQDDYRVVKQSLFGRGQIDPRHQERIETKLRELFPRGEAFLFSSARGALATFLKFYLEQSHRKSVLTQAYSCLVVPNAIRAAGGKPIFVDVKTGSVNVSLEDLQKKTSREAAVLIIQNTFGIPADYDRLLEVARNENLLVIENLAHALGARLKGQALGSFGDVALLSFGRSKVISSMIGGAIVINNQKLAEDFRLYYQTIPEPSAGWVLRQLGHAFVSWHAKQHYRTVGKPLMAALRRLRLSSFEIEPAERRGALPAQWLTKFPLTLTPLLAHQLGKLDSLNMHRVRIANIYRGADVLPCSEIISESEPVFLRYPMFTTYPERVLERAKRQGIYLGNWYHSVLAPARERLDRFGYLYGMCPEAEKLALGSYNLPTNIDVSPDDAHRISELVKAST